MQFVHLNIKLFVVLFHKHIALIKIFSTPWLSLRPRSPPPFLATSSRCSLSLPPLHNKLQFQQIKNATATCGSDVIGTKLKITTQLSALSLFLNYSYNGKIKIYIYIYILRIQYRTVFSKTVYQNICSSFFTRRPRHHGHSSESVLPLEHRQNLTEDFLYLTIHFLQKILKFKVSKNFEIINSCFQTVRFCFGG